MSITKVSASKLESYVSCPYRYYIKYIQNMGDKGERTEPMHFGTMIHEVLKDFHEWIKNTPIPKDREQFNKVIYYKTIELIQQKINKYKEIIKRPMSSYNIYNDHISHYLKYFIDNNLYLKNLDSEKEFNVSIDEIATTISNKDMLSPLVKKYKDVILTGKIDLVIYPDIIIDFKIQGKKSFSKDFVSNFQSIFYTLIYPRDMSFIYIFLWKKFETAEIKLSNETRLNKLNLIVSLIDVINNTKVFNPRPKSCRACIFKSICSKKSI